MKGYSKRMKGYFSPQFSVGDHSWKKWLGLWIPYPSENSEWLQTGRFFSTQLLQWKTFACLHLVAKEDEKYSPLGWPYPRDKIFYYEKNNTELGEQFVIFLQKVFTKFNSVYIIKHYGVINNLFAFKQLIHCCFKWKDKTDQWMCLQAFRGPMLNYREGNFGFLNLLFCFFLLKYILKAFFLLGNVYHVNTSRRTTKWHEKNHVKFKAVLSLAL